ncbi:MAG: hypothetical protein J4G00_10225 [Actinomycetia bacterium]|nr:hypothetical protein [Actinomycetes bacterium]
MGRSRLIGIYLTVVGIAVAVQFVLHPLYGTNSLRSCPADGGVLAQMVCGPVGTATK